MLRSQPALPTFAARAKPGSFELSVWGTKAVVYLVGLSDAFKIIER